jgi:signal transduction histidine kinase
MTAVRRFSPGPLGRRDLVVVAVATLVEVLGLRTGLPAPDPSAVAGIVGLLLALTQGLALLWRHRHPEAVLALVTVAFVAHALLLVPVPPYAGWVALATVAARRDVRGAALAAGGVVAACALAYLPTAGPADDVVMPVLVTVAVAVTAQLVRERQARAAALRSQAAAEERLRIARDLHDVLGHSLSGIAVQSSAGRLALEAGQPDVARDSLAAIEAASRESMAEVREVLGRLREDTGPGLSRLDELVRSASPMVAVVVTRDGELADLPDAVGRTAYRVVQEGLTNAVRHAAPCQVRVSVRRLTDRVEIEVLDDGAGHRASTRTPGGHGLVGMRERVAALGGDVDAGPAADGGWRVIARLPVPRGGAA